MGTGGEEPLQGAAGITQVRARGHRCGGETLHTRPLVLWALILGAGLGWPMEEEDIPGISRADVQKMQAFGKCGSLVRVWLWL